MARAPVEMLKRRRTRIVATLGPASTDPATVARLIEAGVDVFRLNFSHGDHDTHGASYATVRAAAEAAGTPTAILADLCGPKIRVGRFDGGELPLTAGETVTVTTRDVVGGPGLVPSQYEALAADVHPGCRILLADGLLQLRVESIAGTEIACTVVDGGILKDRKGMNLPDVALSTPAMTEKDIEDARFAAGLGVDFLALSFVRHAADVEQLRELLEGNEARIVAKIEHPVALENIDAIVAAADGIMVARGDLGVELPPEDVPVIQQELVARARAAAKPSIVATQMLESMIENPRPTRAEVSDVSTAVFSGADAVMLSAETASGSFPVEAVQIMDRVARTIEAHLWSESGFLMPPAAADGPLAPGEAIARSVAQLSRDLGVRAVVAFSDSGATGRVLASARPAAPLVVATTFEQTLHQSNLLWGVVPRLLAGEPESFRHETARRIASELGLAEEGHRILTVAGLGADAIPAINVVTV